jgi:KaiC/GvpD/RAD55 family RecA-like ATPase
MGEQAVVEGQKAAGEKPVVEEQPVVDKQPAAEEKPKVDVLEDPNFIKTGVPGFDDLMEKGMPKGSSILVCGGPGSGKTTFCLNTLCHAAGKGEKCLYLSFEENKNRLYDHMRNYGFNPDQLEKDGNLAVIRKNPFEISRGVEALLAKARGELLIEIDEIQGLIPEGFKPDRIVLDSLSAIAAAFVGKEEGYRIYIEQLFDALKNIGATSFLISEVEQTANKYSKSGVEEFLADAIFAFYNIRRGNVRVSAVEIIKIRGAVHKKKVVPFSMIPGKGIEVYPLEEVFTK